MLTGYLREVASARLSIIQWSDKCQIVRSAEQVRQPAWQLPDAEVFTLRSVQGYNVIHYITVPVVPDDLHRRLVDLRTAALQGMHKHESKQSRLALQPALLLAPLGSCRPNAVLDRLNDLYRAQYRAVRVLFRHMVANAHWHVSAEEVRALLPMCTCMAFRCGTGFACKHVYATLLTHHVDLFWLYDYAMYTAVAHNQFARDTPLYMSVPSGSVPAYTHISGAADAPVHAAWCSVAPPLRPLLAHYSHAAPAPPAPAASDDAPAAMDTAPPDAGAATDRSSSPVQLNHSASANVIEARNRSRERMLAALRELERETQKCILAASALDAEVPAYAMDQMQKRAADMTRKLARFRTAQIGKKSMGSRSEAHDDEDDDDSSNGGDDALLVVQVDVSEDEAALQEAAATALAMLEGRVKKIAKKGEGEAYRTQKARKKDFAERWRRCVGAHVYLTCVLSCLCSVRLMAVDVLDDQVCAHAHAHAVRHMQCFSLRAAIAQAHIGATPAPQCVESGR